MFLRRSILAGSAVVLLCASSGEAFAPSSLPGRVATPRALSQLRMVRTPPPVEDGTLEDGSADDSRRAFIGKLGLGAASLVGVRKIADGGVYLDSPDLSGKQVVVTGGNTGLGKQTCIRLASMGADVVLASRSAKRGEVAAQEVRDATGSDKVKSAVLDLASLKSIEEFAAAFSERPLDVLVNNAGVMAIPTRETTAEGFERQFGINHLGHFHLTSLLMPALKRAGGKTGDARVINVSSEAHQIAFAGLDFDDLMFDKDYDPWKAYGGSKLANILFTRELQRRLGDAAGVSACALHPGVVATELGRNFFVPESACSAVGSTDCKGNLPPLALAGFALTAPAMALTVKSPAQGAMTQVRCAADPKLQKLNGDYFKDCEVMGTSGPAKDMAAAGRLWDVSEALTGRVFAL